MEIRKRIPDEGYTLVLTSKKMAGLIGALAFTGDVGKQIIGEETHTQVMLLLDAIARDLGFTEDDIQRGKE